MLIQDWCNSSADVNDNIDVITSEDQKRIDCQKHTFPFTAENLEINLDDSNQDPELMYFTKDLYNSLQAAAKLNCLYSPALIAEDQ